MTYKVRVIAFASPHLSTFAEAWATLISEFYKLPVTMRSEQMIQDGVCWIQRSDGLTFRIDAVQCIASALGLISGEGEGFMFLTDVSTDDRASKLEPFAQGTIEQWLILKAIKKQVLEAIERISQTISKKPMTTSLSSEEIKKERKLLILIELLYCILCEEREMAKGQ